MTGFAAVALALAVGLGAGAPQAPAWAQARAQAGSPAAQAGGALLSAEAAALARALSREADGPVDRFYAARDYAPLWLGDTARLGALGAAVASAGAHALPADRYDAAAVAQARAQGAPAEPEAAAALELRLTRTFLAYARDLGSGVLVPSAADPDIHVRPPRPEPGALLDGMAASQDPAGWLAALAPTDPDYAALVGRLAAWRALAAGATPVPEVGKGPSLKLGDRSERVRELRARLVASGDLAPEDERGAADGAADGAQLATNDVVTDLSRELPGAATADTLLFDETLEAAVQRFQERHGLNRDGVVGPATRAALNADPADRVRQIAVNLERLRWLNRDLGRRHIVVNLAGFEMALVEDGARVFTSRVVVGKTPKHRTPEFSDEMEYMVVNPTWHVPKSIAHEEILPELRRDPTYLARKNMRIEGTDLDPSLIDWNFVTPGNFPGRIKQAPGSGNALGRVKFMFPNPFSIYLHDTPSRSLFARDLRAFSHGCVRVQKPIELAHRLLEGQAEDPVAFFQTHLDRGREVYLHLDEHLPVHLTYRTAWVDGDGGDQFRTDVYGRDARVAAALGAAGVQLVP